MHIFADTCTGLTRLIVLLQDHSKLLELDLAIPLDIDHVERLANLCLVHTALVSRHPENELLKVEKAILIGLHELEHGLPFVLGEAHVAEVVGEALQDIHFGQEAVPRDIDQSKNFAERHDCLLALTDPGHLIEKNAGEIPSLLRIETALHNSLFKGHIHFQSVVDEAALVISSCLLFKLH